MSKLPTIAVEARERAGKGASRAIRRAGRVPAVVYGAKKDPEMVSIDKIDLIKAIRSSAFLSTVYEIKVNGKAQQVLPRDIHFHPVTDEPTHVDFMRMTKGASVTVQIPVHFVDEEQSPGLKRGGVMNVVRHDIEMDCPASAIPEYIEVSVAGLDINDSVHISEVKLPEGAKPTIDRDFTIATIGAPSSLRSAEAEAEGEEGEDVEVEATEQKGDEAESENGDS